MAENEIQKFYLAKDENNELRIVKKDAVFNGTVNVVTRPNGTGYVEVNVGGSQYKRDLSQQELNEVKKSIKEDEKGFKIFSPRYYDNLSRVIFGNENAQWNKYQKTTSGYVADDFNPRVSNREALDSIKNDLRQKQTSQIKQQEKDKMKA